MKDWSDLSKEEKQEFIKRMDCEVKVKFSSGEIIGFNPFKVCASFPTQYLVKNYSNGGKMEYNWEEKLKQKIKNNGVESNNVKYLEEANIDIGNVKLNSEL